MSFSTECLSPQERDILRDAIKQYLYNCLYSVTAYQKSLQDPMLSDSGFRGMLQGYKYLLDRVELVREMLNLFKQG